MELMPLSSPRMILRLKVVLLIFALSACGGVGGEGEDNQTLIAEPQAVPPQLNLTLVEPPVDLPNTAARFSADVRYGDAERNLFDIYLPDSNEATPLVIYFHGGGYVAGDKVQVRPDDIRAFLAAGIAFASINYPFINTDPPYDNDGVIKPLMSSARALQFIRYHHESLNLDPKRIGAYGISAGASTSLWLGIHDNLADSNNTDPVLRESSRVNAVAALSTQATLNFLRWEDILAPIVGPIFPDTSILAVTTALGEERLLFAATGVDSVEELGSTDKRPYMENIDVIGLMDAGDAPVYAYNDTQAHSGGVLLNLFLHHALHVVALHTRAEEVGLENVMYAIDPVYSLADPSGEGHISFLMRHIQ